MSRNWMRHFELVLTDNNGNGILLSEFKVTFKIEWKSASSPSVATVTIYNLSTETQNKIIGRQFSKMKIIAGYDGIAPDVAASDVGKVKVISDDQVGQHDDMNFGLLFSGDIRFTATGKTAVTDSWLVIQASDGFDAYNKAFIKTPLAKGYTLKNVYDLLLEALKPYGMVAGMLPTFPTTVFPRGKVFHGFVRDYLTELVKQFPGGAIWQFVGDRLDIYTKEMSAHQAITLNAGSGLMVQPQKTAGSGGSSSSEVGINVRCLINPNIKLNGLIEVDAESLKSSTPDSAIAEQSQAAAKPSTGKSATGKSAASQPAESKPQSARLSSDGLYIVRSITYLGDTRGQNWYMDLVCDAHAPVSTQSQGGK
ncbi:hypothetical protein [Serratia sp. DD3]|uniref:hypothetical protein n=1 Tax=Serratia sp. DD3 TaxID=1410619 RepID=UPI0003C50992|nr:hypothetical protein [Serratia sp. DD3]KEY56935.1 hypothetical protein SRDD_41840 [Serratia sp. DD3]